MPCCWMNLLEDKTHPRPTGVTHEAAVTTAADASESSNGQVSENRSGAALRQSSQSAPLKSGDVSNNLRGVGS